MTEIVTDTTKSAPPTSPATSENPENPPAADGFITGREAARRLSVHYNTVKAMATDGRLPHVFKPGSTHRRYRESDVETLRLAMFRGYRPAQAPDDGILIRRVTIGTERVAGGAPHRHFTLQPAMDERLVATAIRLGVSVSTVLRIAVAEYLNRTAPEETTDRPIYRYVPDGSDPEVTP